MVSRAIVLALVLCAGQARAQDPGADTCASGFVWREAFASDHVCVEPAVRAQAASDNHLASQRREPGGGAYGADTCRSGFVWREAGAEDRVCVTPETRAHAASDNQAAAGRLAHARAPGRLNVQGKRRLSDLRIEAETRAVQIPPIFRTPPASPGTQAKRGFDENGNPYVEEPLPDGSVRRAEPNGVRVIRPDGSSEFFPPTSVRQNAQPPTPPDLPGDPELGREWVTQHNDQLLTLIRTLVAGDEAEMQKFEAAESRQVGADLFGQVEYRTRVLETLVKP